MTVSPEPNYNVACNLWLVIFTPNKIISNTGRFFKNIKQNNSINISGLKGID